MKIVKTRTFPTQKSSGKGIIGEVLSFGFYIDGDFYVENVWILTILIFLSNVQPFICILSIFINFIRFALSNTLITLFFIRTFLKECEVEKLPN